MYGIDGKNIVGKKVNAIYMDEKSLLFETDQGDVAWEVEGECCSYSYFYDFHGVKKLLENGPVISMAEIDLADPEDEDAQKGDVVEAYGFEIVTEHPTWGAQTSVVSFRNDSNGYYGGWMSSADPAGIEKSKMTKLDDDCLGLEREW